MLDPHRLRVLVAVAETGTVTGAAEVLHYGQPTISHHLAKLEQETGAVLIQRVGRGVRLTNEGRQLAERGAQILGLLDRAEVELESASNLEAGIVRLACFPSAVATIVPRLLGDLHARHPGLQVEIMEAEPPEAGQLITSSGADLALAFSYPEQAPDEQLNAQSIGHDDLYLVVRRGSDGKRVADYADQPWLAGCERCRTHLVATCRAAGFEPPIRFASDDFVASQALVSAGLGVTILPGLALTAFRHDGVDVHPITDARRELWLLSYGQPPLPPSHAAVAAAISTAAGEFRNGR